jgi:hypothetical protein
MRTLVGVVLLCVVATAAAEPAVDPCGPLTGAIIENWARRPTPQEQARVEELRRACRAHLDAYADLRGLPPPQQLERLKELYREGAEGEALAVGAERVGLGE